MSFRNVCSGSVLTSLFQQQQKLRLFIKQKIQIDKIDVKKTIL